MRYTVSILVAMFLTVNVKAQTEHQKVTAAAVKVSFADPIGAEITDTKLSDIGNITGIILMANKPRFYTQQKIMQEFDKIRKKEPPSRSPEGSGFRDNITVLNNWNYTEPHFKNEGFNYIAVWKFYKESVLVIYIGNEKLMFMIIPAEAWK